MQTLTIDPGTADETALAPAATWLRQGGIVAFPTDTVYGLAVDPEAPTAVLALFAVKGRDARAALPLIAASTRQVEALCGPLMRTAARLAARFWPGPLSLLMDAPPGIVAQVHGGHRSVAIRVPDHRVARALAAAFGGPVTATSANRSGDPPAVTPAAIGSLAADPRLLVIDAGAAPGGPASTIVDPRVNPPALVRAGAVAWERVLESLKG